MKKAIFSCKRNALPVKKGMNGVLGRALPILLIIAVALAAYGNSFSNSFVYDGLGIKINKLIDEKNLVRFRHFLRLLE